MIISSLSSKEFSVIKVPSKNAQTNHKKLQMHKRYTPFTLCLALLTLLLGCVDSSSNSTKDNVLVYCSEASPQTFNPQLVTSGSTFDASSKQIYNRLVDFQPGASLIEGSLANRWEISKNGKEYTFYLRKDVVFHSAFGFEPTRNFNADDVLFSFERQRNLKHPYHNVSPLSYRYFESMGLRELIVDIIKIDDHIVKFILKDRDAPFIATLAMDFASILSEEYARHLTSLGTPQQIDIDPIGTGPFQLVRYQPDAFIRYKAHPNYWNGKERIKNLVFAITPDPSLRFARLIAGECDIMAKPLPIQIEAVKDYPYLNTMSAAGSNVSYLAMNTLKKPFDNQKVRLALNYAINKKAILKIVYHSTAEEAKNPIPPNIWSYDDSIQETPHSYAQAKQLLIEAGYPNGFEMDLWAMPVQRAYNPNAVKMAELIQQDLGKIGVSARIVSFEFGTFLKKVKNGEHQSALLGWIGDNGDPDNYFSSTLSCDAARSGNNASFWCDSEFDSLIKQAGKISDISERTKLYIKAQQRFNQEKPWVPIAHARQFILVNNKVKNLKLSPTDGMYFSGVTLIPQSSIKKENSGRLLP